MGSSSSKIELQISVDDKDVRPSLAALSAEVKRLGLMTETAFSGKNLAALGVKPIADIRAEMNKLTTAYRDVAASGIISAEDQARALTSLRNKQKALYAEIAKPPNPPKLQTARDTLGIKSQAEITAAIHKTRQAYTTLAASGKLSTSELVRAKAALGKRLDEINGKVDTAKKGFYGLGPVVAGAFAASALAGYAGSVIKIADQYTNLSSRLKIVTTDSAELKTVEDGLFATAQRTGSAYEANVGSYVKLAMSLKKSGAASQEILGINEMVSQSLVVSGATTSEASSFMLQFGQAMGSGVLQGDEFRSMMENNGYFAQQLAKALDTDIAGLRKMSKDGQLTTDVLRGAFKTMAAEIDTAFTSMPMTIGRAMMGLENSYKRIIDDSNKAGNGTGTVAQEILKLSQTLDQNHEKIGNFFGAIISGSIDAVKAVWNVGTAITGLMLVASGDLPFLKYATMNAKELDAYLKGIDVKSKGLEIDPSKFGELSKLTGATISSVDDVWAAIDAGKLKKDELTNTWIAGDKAIAASAKKTAEELAAPESPSKKADVGYRTPEYLDRLDERVLSPEELADRKKRWAEREQQEKTLNDEKNTKLDEVANANAEEDAKRERIRKADAERWADPKSPYYDPKKAAAYKIKTEDQAAKDGKLDKAAKPLSEEDAKREKIRQLDAKRKADPNSIYYKPTERVVDSVRVQSEKRPAEVKPPEEPAAEQNKPVQVATASGSYKIPEGQTKGEKDFEKAQKKSDAEAVSRNLAARGQESFRNLLRINADPYQKIGENILEGSTLRNKQAEEKIARQKQAAEEITEAAAQIEEWSRLDTVRIEEAKKRNEELAESAKKSAADRIKAEGDGIKAAQSVFEKYAARVKELQDEIAGRERSLADELSKLDPHATEEQRWRRKAKAAADYEKAAKAAMAAGRLSDARDYADQARTAYSGLKDDKGKISAALAGRTAFSGVNSAGNLGLAISKMMTEAAAKAAKAGIMGIDGLNNRVAAQLQNAVGAIAASMPSGPGKEQPVQVHELRLGKARLQGSPDDVNEFLRQIKLAGLAA